MNRDRAPPLDIYLQPAVVGGGLGDIEEVLAVGRKLAAAGLQLRRYRRPDRPMPRTVDGPWDWPPVVRRTTLDPRAERALTVTPWWGVSAAPRSDQSGAGPWGPETGDIEQAYGSDRVVHLSLEEFARTLTSRQQTGERWREGGVSSREIRRRLRDPRHAREIDEFHREYRRWRALDRPNVLHLFSGFRPSRAFAREFPEAIQTGPIWPSVTDSGGPRAPSRRSNRWIWYASPSTSERLALAVATAFDVARPARRPLELQVRSPRPLALPTRPGLRWRRLPPLSAASWHRRFRSAELRIVTGSRTLLEALELGGRFLYFNGVTHGPPRTRRHRPEKIDALLAAWRARGVSRRLRRDLSDFARLRSVGPVLSRALRDERWRRSFPPPSFAVGFRPPWDDAGELIVNWVDRWSSSGRSAADFVRDIRTEARAALARNWEAHCLSDPAASGCA
jgi:hypothetical protein